MCTVEPPPPEQLTAAPVPGTPLPRPAEPTDPPVECLSACFRPEARWIWKMLVLQPSAASMDTDSHESWLELRDSTLFSSSREEEDGEEEDTEVDELEEPLLPPADP